MRESKGCAGRVARGRGFAAWLGALAVMAGTAGTAGAENFTVTSNADSGTGTLRAALTAAAANGEDLDTITFNLPDGSSIVLLSALPDVTSTDSITFNTGGDTITLNGSDAGITQPYFTVRNLATFNGLSFQGGEIASDPTTGYFITANQNVLLGSDFSGPGVGFDKFGTATATITSDVVLPFAAGHVFVGTLVVANGGRLELKTHSVNPNGVMVVESGGTLAVEELLVQSGGLLTSNGAITATVDTTIESGGTLTGNLMLDDGGAVGSVFTLQADANLFGSGSITADAITLAGRVAPSTATGTFALGGPTTFAAGSTYEADLRADGSGDRIDVSGAVTIEPGAVLFTLLDPSEQFTGPTSVTVLTGSSVTGEFDLQTNSTFLFLSQTVDYSTPGEVNVDLTPTGVNIPLTPNQQSVLDAVNAATPDPSSDLDSVQTVVNTTFQGSADAYRELLDAIGGESHTAFATGRQLLGERTARALHRRARDPAWGDARAVYAADAAAPAPVFAGPARTPLGWRAAAPVSAPARPGAATFAPAPRARVGAWLDGFGQYGELDGGDFGEAQLDSVLYGGTLGVDAWIDDRFLFGVAAGYARADLEPEDREGEFTSDTIQGALYAGYAGPRGYLSAYGRYALSFQDSEREIEAAQLRRTATADWDAEDTGAGAEAGVTLFSIGTLGFQPIAGIDWLQLSEESYREKGAGSLDLAVDPEDLESTTARFGARIFGKIDLDGAGLLVPELRAFWQREFGDTERVLRARLLGDLSRGAIAVRGAELPRDALILGLGWSADVGEALQILLDYDALLDTDRVEHQGSLAVRVRF